MEDTLSSTLPTAKKKTTEDELRKARLVLFVLLTVNSGLVMYISWGNVVSVASAGVTYLAVALRLGRLFRWWEPSTDGGGRRRWHLDAIIWFLFLSLAVLQISRLPRSPASWTSATMLVAVAGAAALGVGGCCAYMLHRPSWSKHQRHEVIFLPLTQDPRS